MDAILQSVRCQRAGLTTDDDDMDPIDEPSCVLKRKLGGHEAGVKDDRRGVGNKIKSREAGGRRSKTVAQLGGVASLQSLPGPRSRGLFTPPSGLSSAAPCVYLQLGAVAECRLTYTSVIFSSCASPALDR